MPWLENMDYYREVDRAMYREELDEWLPERILDCHVHCFLLEHQWREPTDAEREGSLGSDREPFGVDELRGTLGLLYPGRHCEALVFGTASAYYSIEAQNRYVGECCARDEALDGLALLDPALDEEALAAVLDATGLVGLKPYETLTGKRSAEVTLRDMVPDAARRVVEDRGLLVMLHLPRPGRIADPDNIREVVELCEECPNGRIVLAHIGRSFGPWFIEQAIGTLRSLPNLTYDIAAVDDADAMEVVLKEVGPERLLFGSDLPYTLDRGKHLCVNRQCLFLTREKRPWSVSSDEPGKLRLTFMVYETLRALRRVCERLGLGQTEVAAVCRGNARSLIERARGFRRSAPSA